MKPDGGEIFDTCPDQPSLLYNGYWVSFLGVKQPGHGIDHPPPSIAEVKERVELYLYSPSGPFWPVLGRTLPLLLPIYNGVLEIWKALKLKCITLSKNCIFQNMLYGAVKQFVN